MLRLIAAILALGLVAAAPATRPATQPADLRAQMAADAQVIQKSLVALNVHQIAAQEAELAKTRQAARGNLERLEKGKPVEHAKAHHAKLKELSNKLNASNAIKWQVIDAVRRRHEAADRLAALNEKPDPADDAARIERIAGQALAPVAVEAALKIPALGDAAEPRSDDPERALWFYRVCRTIEAINKAHQAAGVVNKWEAASVKLLNDYRESLGLMPLEIDPRLCASARRHSKEMVDLDYFGHTSPTPGYRSSVERMRKAGYTAGWSENICKNVGDAERAFWLWFGSPGHHLAMTAENEVAIGAGRWDNAWTHHFGHGMRLSQLPANDRRDALANHDPPTAPQADTAKLPPVTITRIETEITIIDPKTGKRTTIPGPTKTPDPDKTR